MLSENSDKDDYVLYEHGENASLPRKCLRILYDYSIGSCIASLPRSAPAYHRSNTGTQNIEMDSMSSSRTNAVLKNPEKPTTETFRKIDKQMKEKVNRHFENHFQKWKNRKRFPFKVMLDLLLIVLVTTQVIMFAEENYKFTKFLINNQEAFKHYFIQSNCNGEEVDKLFTIREVYSQITRIVESYYNISELIGSFQYVSNSITTANDPPALQVQIDYYDLTCGSIKDESTFFPYQNSHLVHYTTLFLPNSNLTKSNKVCCDTETTSTKCSFDHCDCSVEEQIKCYINTTNFERFNQMQFKIKLFTHLRAKVIEDTASPVNGEFDIRITLSNDYHSSIAVDLNVSSTVRRYCNHFTPKRTLITAVDAVIIFLLLISTITHSASFIRTYRLAKDLKLHFFAFHKRRLRWTDELIALFNKWYIFMLFTNIVIFVAEIMKLIFENKVEISSTLLETVRILLGSGILLLWCGLFGLLSYFESLNVLFITIRLAIPSVLRFGICIFIFFMAFVISGWLILGPYHPKFDEFSFSLLTLFCILIGDDIYNTFAQAYSRTQSSAVRFFSIIYLILFVFIFLYAVLSLFIGIFNHAYESLSENWKDYSRGYLRDWAEGKQKDNDPTESYPFPVPPVRNPATNTDNIQVDTESSAMATNNNQSKFITEDVSTTIIELPNEQPYVNNQSTHFNCISNTSNKLLVSQPPIATRNEVNEARFRLQESFLINDEFEEYDDNHDDGKVN